MLTLLHQAGKQTKPCFLLMPLILLDYINKSQINTISNFIPSYLSPFVYILPYQKPIVRRYWETFSIADQSNKPFEVTIHRPVREQIIVSIQG
jgi:hypothetical protein